MKTLLLLLALALGAQDPTGGAAAPAEPPDLLIVHFNDFHGQVLPRRVVRHPGRPPAEMGGLSALAHHVGRRRAEHGERLWVTNGGDWIKGTPEGAMDGGISVMAALERLQLAASVLGNHEYDFGEQHLLELVGGLRHPVLGANVRERGERRLRPYVLPYLVRTVRSRSDPAAAVRVALVGLVTRDTPRVSTGPFGSAEFADEAETLAELWPALQRDADAVVLLTHCGVRTDRELARRFPEVVLVLGGHSHSELRRPLVEGRTSIVQSGSRGAAVTEVGLRVRGEAPRLQVTGTRFVELEAAAGRDPATDRFVQECFAAVAQRWDRPIGEVSGAPDRRAGAGSTPAGNFVAGLIRAAGRADVGLHNKGGLRSTLEPGPITRRQVFELLPFENVVVTFELTGAALREVLAQSLSGGSRPLEIDGGGYTYAVVDGRRELRSVTVGGAPLDPERVYRVATNSFLASGGDGFAALAAATPRERGHKVLRDLMIDHLAAHGTARLSAEQRIRLDRR